MDDYWAQLEARLSLMGCGTATNSTVGDSGSASVQADDEFSRASQAFSKDIRPKRRGKRGSKRQSSASPELNELSPPVLTCQKCNSKFVATKTNMIRTRFLQHCQKHSSPVKCVLCGFESKWDAEMNKHFYRKHGMNSFFQASLRQERVDELTNLAIECFPTYKDYFETWRTKRLSRFCANDSDETSMEKTEQAPEESVTTFERSHSSNFVLEYDEQEVPYEEQANMMIVEESTVFKQENECHQISKLKKWIQFVDSCIGEVDGNIKIAREEETGTCPRSDINEAIELFDKKELQLYAITQKLQEISEDPIGIEPLMAQEAMLLENLKVEEEMISDLQARQEQYYAKMGFFVMEADRLKDEQQVLQSKLTRRLRKS